MCLPVAPHQPFLPRDEQRLRHSHQDNNYYNLPFGRPQLALSILCPALFHKPSPNCIYHLPVQLLTTPHAHTYP